MCAPTTATSKRRSLASTCYTAFCAPFFSPTNHALASKTRQPPAENAQSGRHFFALHSCACSLTRVTRFGFHHRKCTTCCPTKSDNFSQAQIHVHCLRTQSSTHTIAQKQWEKSVIIIGDGDVIVSIIAFMCACVCACDCIGGSLTQSMEQLETFEPQLAPWNTTFFCYRSCFLLLLFFFKLLWSTLFVCENLFSLWHNSNSLTSSVRVGVETCKLMNFCRLQTNTQTHKQQ